MFDVIRPSGHRRPGAGLGACFDPATLMIAAAVVSGGSQIVGGIQANNAAKASAQASDEAAKTTEFLAAQNEAAARNDARRLQGQQIAAAGASGLDFTGSVRDFTLDTAIETERAALMERFRGQQQATGLRTDAILKRAEGKQALFGGILSGVATMAGGVGRAMPGKG